MRNNATHSWRSNERVVNSTTPFVVAILSGKGGIGKSVIAHELAVALGRTGATTALVDMDWRLGSQHILTNAVTRWSVLSLTQGTKSASEVAVPVAPNVDLFASASINDGGVWPTVAQTAQIYSALRTQLSRYSYVVVDTPSGLMEQVGVLAHAVDMPLLICAPELTAIADCYGLYKHLVSYSRDLRVRIVVNRATDLAEGEDIAQRFIGMAKEFLGIAPQFITTLPEDRAVSESVAHQRSVSSGTSHARFATAVSSLAGRIVGVALKNRTESENLTFEPTTLNYANKEADTTE